MEGSRSTSCQSPVAFRTLNPKAAAFALSAEVAASSTTSTFSTRRRASRCTRPMKPVPITAVRIRLTSNPPGRGGLFLDHQLAQQRGRLAQAFVGRHQAVFMLDREHIVIAIHAQGGDE